MQKKKSQSRKDGLHVSPVLVYTRFSIQSFTIDADDPQSFWLKHE